MGKVFCFPLIVGITQYQWSFLRKKLKQAQLLLQKQLQTGNEVLSQCFLEVLLIHYMEDVPLIV